MPVGGGDKEGRDFGFGCEFRKQEVSQLQELKTNNTNKLEV